MATGLGLGVRHGLLLRIPGQADSQWIGGRVSRNRRERVEHAVVRHVGAGGGEDGGEGQRRGGEIKKGGGQVADDQAVSLRDFLVHLMDEREKQNNLRFIASETAVSAALNAQKEAVNSAFLASEKAITKAEEAQTAYNSRSNEFRAALSDQNTMFMHKAEAATVFKGIDDKILEVQRNFDIRIGVLRADTEKSIEALLKEISSLRESRSEETGNKMGVKDLWAWIIAAISMGIALFSHIKT